MAAAGITGPVAFMLALLFGDSWLGASICAGFSGAIAAGAVIDLQERRIPNRLTYSGLVVGLILAGISGVASSVEAVGGIVLAGGAMGVMWVLGRGALGLGDVKLSAMAGAFLGAGSVPLYLLLGSLLGATAGALLLLRGAKRGSTFAYGPYLGAGALLAMLIAGPLVH